MTESRGNKKVIVKNTENENKIINNMLNSIPKTIDVKITKKTSKYIYIQYKIENIYIQDARIDTRFISIIEIDILNKSWQKINRSVSSKYIKNI